MGRLPWMGMLMAAKLFLLNGSSARDFVLGSFFILKCFF